MTDDLVIRVEQACRQLSPTGDAVTFDAVAARVGIGRATLYRRPELRAIIEEHRQHGRDALTLTGLASRSTSSATGSKPSPPTSAATKNNSANSTAPTDPNSLPAPAAALSSQRRLAG